MVLFKMDVSNWTQMNSMAESCPISNKSYLNKLAMFKWTLSKTVQVQFGLSDWFWFILEFIAAILEND